MTVFGLQWTQATGACVRPAGSALTHLAVTSPTNAETLAAVAQASTYAPWSGMRRCNLWDDGTPTAYYGNRCYTDTDVANMGQAMVRIPKFWYTTDHGAGVYIWYISDTGADTLPTGADHAWAVHPAFIRNGVTKDYIYLGAFEAYFNATTSKLESRAGVTPKSTYRLAYFRRDAQLRVPGGTAPNKWEVQDYNATSAAQLLYLLEYGNLDSQAVVGAGYTDGTYYNTGATGSTGTERGNASYGTASTSVGMCYRGIENLWGNYGTMIDGINICGAPASVDYRVYVADHGFAVGTSATPYVDTTIVMTYGTWATSFMQDIATTAAFDYCFLPSSVSNVTTKFYDKTETGFAGAHQVQYGGASYFVASAGVFCLSSGLVPTDSLATVGSRLMYIG